MFTLTIKSNYRVFTHEESIKKKKTSTQKVPFHIFLTYMINEVCQGDLCNMKSFTMKEKEVHVQ